MNARFQSATLALWLSLALAIGIGALGRGYWTPDEPREADIAWRMSRQADKAVPLLAGEPFCEKPPLTYWAAGAAIAAWGNHAWVSRLPNLLYALITALAVGAIARRSTGRLAGAAAAAAICTLLLTYQASIWLATDAPLLAASAAALWGLYTGFYAVRTRERLIGYTVMHAALAVGFLAKSAAAWMVPFLAFAALVAWEKRWRELKRWELWSGLALQAVPILAWVGFVYAGPEGPAHLKVFLWNNLAGRFARVEAPAELQYAAAHRNTPGKYLEELPVYLWPWTLLAAAAVRRAWRDRHSSVADRRIIRFATAAFLPALAVLSIAATARNIYLAPAMPGIALLLGWWAQAASARFDRWESRAVQATAALLEAAVVVSCIVVFIVGSDSWTALPHRAVFVGVSVAGIAGAAVLALGGWRAVRRGLMLRALCALSFAYCALLIGPASQIYRRVDTWQDLASIGTQLRAQTAGRPLILFAADETTRAFVDMYARTSVVFIAPPVSAASISQLRAALGNEPSSAVLAQVPGRTDNPALRQLAERVDLGRLVPNPQPVILPSWAGSAALGVQRVYSLPNGRRYVLLEMGNRTVSR